MRAVVHPERRGLYLDPVKPPDELVQVQHAVAVGVEVLEAAAYGDAVEVERLEQLLQLLLVERTVGVEVALVEERARFVGSILLKPIGVASWRRPR